ncbi:MAG: hypothetical protein AB8F78_02000 [Saprospiraceae bacterium]
MGWKASMIFANSNKEVDLNTLFESFGIYNLQKTDSHFFETVMDPDDDKIYIGKFNGNTIICMQDIPIDSLNDSMSTAETELSKAFDKVDIVTLILHSVVNLWGYSVVKNGQKVRVRAGSSEGGTMVENGDPLPEEEALLSQSRVSDTGERLFTIDGLPDEEFTEDQVGENFVFNISATYFGESLDSSDGLFETEFDGYTFSRSKPKHQSTKPESKTTEIIRAKKPWWKFW